MPNAQQVQKYFNIFARALRVVEDFPENKAQIFALENSKEISIETRTFLLAKFKLDKEEFLKEIEMLIVSIEEADESCKFVKALTMCQFLDEIISYLDSCDGTFSVFSLVSVYSNNVVVLDEPLNGNYKETGIWINPKFIASLLYKEDPQQDYPQRLFNRDGYMGINGDLNNISYIKWDSSLSITNVIVPNEFSVENSSCFKIAFSPLLNRKDLLDTDIIRLDRGGKTFTGECLKKLNHSTELEKSFCSAWSMACKANANILFAPEMLCTEIMAKIDNGFNSLIYKMSQEKLLQGESVADITIMPSYWRDCNNSCQITYQNGEILGEQFKFHPYTDKKNGRMESLKEINKKEIILIHIPNVHRIVVMICSDFLTDQEKWLENIVCKQLLPTLILVPSFSPGEQDFINSLSIAKRYGTSVIWGNCCGAKAEGENQIGGCGIVGMDNIMRFRDVNKCGLTCNDGQGCIFTIEIPLKLTGNKDNDTISVKHLLNSDKI
ncbi:MAG: hypothetical protein IKW03_02760 [Clostridia bacterium]|nr:hypothetical protein [Clostridia bacterium]